jgi:hypothetical protein
MLEQPAGTRVGGRSGQCQEPWISPTTLLLSRLAAKNSESRPTANARVADASIGAHDDARCARWPAVQVVACTLGVKTGISRTSTPPRAKSRQPVAKPPPCPGRRWRCACTPAARPLGSRNLQAGEAPQLRSHLIRVWLPPVRGGYAPSGRTTGYSAPPASSLLP